MAEVVEQISDEQAEEALHHLTHSEIDETPEEEVTEPEVVASEPSVEVTAPAEPAVADATEEMTVEVADDDLASLKARNEELTAQVEAVEKRNEARLKAQQERSVANEQILRNRFLQKSTALDKARQVLQATRSEAGVSEADVDAVIRELEGTMNPQSASYAPPPPQPQQQMANDDQVLVMNNFLSEKGMTAEEADRFGMWITNDAPTAMSQQEQSVAGESIGGFLRLAHSRWQDGVREKENEGKRNDAVGAVRSVQRTQREAARAASASTTAPVKQVAHTANETDVSKLTKDDVSTLLRQTVEQGR